MPDSSYLRLNYTRSCLVLLLLTCVNHATHAQNINIYAAASLQNSLSKVITIYKKHHPNTEITINNAGSGTLAKQIKAGASADIFISADQAWMIYLIDHKKIDANQVRNWLGNRLVLIAPRSSTQKIVLQPKPTLAAQTKGFICVAQIQSVPAGRYAWQSFQYYKWTSDLKGRLVETDDVRGTLNFVARQECDLGVVYATDAKNETAVKVLSQFPALTHAKIIYPIALTRQSRKNIAAQRFYRYLQSSDVQQQLTQDGFIWLQR